MAAEKGVFRTISKREIHKAEEISWNTTKGDIKLVSAHDIDIKTKNGVRLGDYEAVERKTSVDLTEVKEIKLIEAMDNGSANDGTGKHFQLGLVFGKSYTFQVVSYTKGVPKNSFSIKWVAKYHSITQKKWIEFPMVSLGTVSNLQFSNDVCGRFIYISAYINNKEEGGKLKLWVHNRFKWFDRKIFSEGLQERMDDPTKINQHATSLCGTAAIVYFYARDNKEDFYKKYMAFFREGKGRINGFELNPNSVMYDCDPSESNLNYPHYDKYANGSPCIPRKLMHQTDWIVLAGTRSSDNKKYIGGEGQNWEAINWPTYMIDAALKLYNAKAAIDNTSIITGWNFLKKLIEIQKEFQNGWNIILLIDADMLKDSISYIGCVTNYHWITYNGDLFCDLENEKYTFSYFCWQQLNIKSIFRSAVFNSNFYGYVKFKK